MKNLIALEYFNLAGDETDSANVQIVQAMEIPEVNTNLNSPDSHHSNGLYGVSTSNV